MIHINNVIETALLIATSTSFSSLCIYFMNRRDRKKEQATANESARSKMLLGLGHDRLIKLTDHYVKRSGITLKEKRNLEYLYSPYEELGGNGDCKIGYDACQLLPIITEEEAARRDYDLQRRIFSGGDLNG